MLVKYWEFGIVKEGNNKLNSIIPSVVSIILFLTCQIFQRLIFICVSCYCRCLISPVQIMQMWWLLRWIVLKNFQLVTRFNFFYYFQLIFCIIILFFSNFPNFISQEDILVSLSSVITYDFSMIRITRVVFSCLYHTNR